MAKITVSFMYDVYSQMLKEEISYSRMVEMLNEKADEDKELITIFAVIGFLGVISFFILFNIYLFGHINIAHWQKLPL